MNGQTTDEGQVKLRLPTDLKAWLQAQAQAARRSLSAEVTVHLEQVRTQKSAPSTQPEALKGNP